MEIIIDGEKYDVPERVALHIDTLEDELGSSNNDVERLEREIERREDSEEDVAKMKALVAQLADMLAAVAIYHQQAARMELVEIGRAVEGVTGECCRLAI